MSANLPSQHAFRVSDLAAKPTRFSLRPDAQQLETWAETLGLDALRKLSFAGDIRPAGKRDWQLTGTLGATLEQPCTVTLAPVRTRIDVDVSRRFTPDYIEPDAPESEMPEDDSVEPLGTWIDPEAVMIEALSLEIPPYPRAGDAAFEGAQIAGAGVTPLTDDAVKPFASLAALRDKMQDDGA